MTLGLSCHNCGSGAVAPAHSRIVNPRALSLQGSALPRPPDLVETDHGVGARRRPVPDLPVGCGRPASADVPVKRSTHTLTKNTHSLTISTATKYCNTTTAT